MNDFGQVASFEETSHMKMNAPKAQGNDAALEQLIQRSKKGAKIKVTYKIVLSFNLSKCFFSAHGCKRMESGIQNYARKYFSAKKD